MKLQSIAARTTLAIGALAVLAFALAAWLITRSVGSVQEASAQRELAALAHREAEAVARSLENHMAQVRGMAAAAEVDGLLGGARAKLPAALAAASTAGAHVPGSGIAINTKSFPPVKVLAVELPR